MSYPIPLAVLILFALFWLAGPNVADRNTNLASTLFSCVYVGAVHGFILPRLQYQRRLHWIIAILTGVVLAGLLEISPTYPASMMFALALIVVSSTASLAGRWPTYLFVSFFILMMTFEQDTELGRQIVSLGWGASMIIACSIITEIVLRLESMVVVKIKRLEAINKIARIITSSLELDQIIPTLNQAIHESIEADSHFLALVEGETLHLQWFYDDGQLFPEMDVPIEGSVSSWVVRNNRSLLLRNLPVEGRSLGVDTRTVGKDRLSLSWIGTPLTANQQVIGIVALASYRQNAFHQEDLDLLESVAQQTAIVLDNAYHHAEAVDQARRDSMTQVFNHAYFLSQLNDLAADCDCQPLSLMMLDIDYFKMFNDTYGHQAGDLALKEVVACIKSCLRASDTIGRWGGEEFAVLLTNTLGSQAHLAARRIQEAISRAHVTTKNGVELPLPTLSIGIAVYPTETTNLEALVHVADQRMYEAKRQGRNQAICE